MKLKKCMLIFPNNVVLCYDLMILDIYNKFRNHMRPNDVEELEKLIFDAYNEPKETLYHKLVKEDDGNLYLYDILSNERADYSSKCKFIYKKSRFFTIKCYEFLILHGYREIIPLAPISHKNLVSGNVLDQYNNFIVYDNRNWSEYVILKSLLGGPDNQYIDRDKICEWFTKNIDKSDNGYLYLTIMSDSYDTDMELARELEAFDSVATQFVKVESRIVTLNRENLVRYNQDKEATKKFPTLLNRSPIGLSKLWSNDYI